MTSPQGLATIQLLTEFSAQSWCVTEPFPRWGAQSAMALWPLSSRLKKSSGLQVHSRPLDQARKTCNVETFISKAKCMHPMPDSLDELSPLQASTTWLSRSKLTSFSGIVPSHQVLRRTPNVWWFVITQTSDQSSASAATTEMSTFDKALRTAGTEQLKETNQAKWNDDKPAHQSRQHSTAF